MIFTNYYIGIIGVVGAMFWTLNFFNVFKKAEIYISNGGVKKNFKYKRIMIFIVGIISWVCLSVALMRPKLPLGYSNNKIEVNDIFFVVDVSRSMLANDFQPNRLEAAKEKIKDFVKLRPKDRIGIIMFSEKAFTLLPLSTDLELINRVVDEISIGMSGLGSGTNIGDALGLAVGRAKQSIADNKVIILLTDGVSNVGFMTPLQAAEEAKESDLKVYTIGIGGEKDAKIPVSKNIFGQTRYQRLPGGSIDLETLEKISTITKAKSFVAQDVKALKNVFNEIEKLERTKIDASSKMIYKELYYNFLLSGFFLLIFSEMCRKFYLKEAL